MNRRDFVKGLFGAAILAATPVIIARPANKMVSGNEIMLDYLSNMAKHMDAMAVTNTERYIHIENEGMKRLLGAHQVGDLVTVKRRLKFTVSV